MDVASNRHGDDVRRRERPWAALLAATVVGLPFGAMYAYSVFLRPFEQALGVTRAELTAIFSLLAVCFTLGMMAGPRLYGRLPTPALLALCTITGAGGTALASVARTSIELALGFGILFGLGCGAAYNVVQQCVNLIVRSRQGLVNGYLVSLFPAGAMLLVPVCGTTIAAYGIRATLAGLAVALAVTGLAGIVLVQLSGVRLADAAPTVASSAPLGNRATFARMFAIFFLAAAAGLMVLSQAAGIIATYGGATGAALFGTTAITGAIALARIGGGWLVDRFTIPAVMAFAQGVSLAGAIGLTVWPSSLAAVICLALIGIGYGFISGASAAAIGVYWAKTAFGRISSRLYVSWCIGALTLPVLAAHLYDLTGGYRIAFIVAGAGNLVAILIALTLPAPSLPALSLPARGPARGPARAGVSGARNVATPLAKAVTPASPSPAETGASDERALEPLRADGRAPSWPQWT